MQDKLKNKIIVNLILLLFFLSICISNLKAQLIIANQGASAATITSSFVGTGLTISTPVLNCSSAAYGTFSGGTALGMSNGVVLTTGIAANLPNNGNTQMSTAHGTICADNQLQALEIKAKNDCCILEFDVIPQCNSISVRFVFASEEYPEFVGAGYNDVFGFFVTGPNPVGGNYANKNIAIVTGTTVCSIDNVNNVDNNSFYVNNSTGTGAGFVFDGYTTAITSSLSVTPCASYHFKLAIADAGDGGWDSAILIDFLQCTNTMGVTVNSTPSTCGLNNGTATATATNGMGTLSYLWSPAPIGGQGTPNATGLTGGIPYTVLVDDIYSCVLPLSSSITIPSTTIPAVTNSPLTQTICSGGNSTAVSLTSNVSGTTFAWTATGTTGLTGFSTSGTSTIPVQSIINTSSTPGTVTYLITPTSGTCSGPVASYTIVVNPTITPTFTPLGPYCQCSTPGLLPGTSINGITGTWSPATISTSTAGTITYTFTPNAGQCAVPATMNVTIDALTVSMPAAGSSTVACPSLVVAPAVPTVLDNCGRTLTVSSPVISIASACSGTQTYTYTYTSCSGTTYPWVYTYTINDNISPTVTGTLTASTVSGCSAAAAPIAVTTVAALEAMGVAIADNCTSDASLTVTSTDGAPAGSCPIAILRTYTIKDACLNTITTTQTINITDLIAPTVTGTIPLATISGCSAASATAAVTTVAALEALGLAIADNCTVDASLVVTSSDVVSGTCPIVVTRTYTIKDACLNSVTVNQVFNITDLIDPTVTGTIPVATISGCSAASATTAVTTVAALEALGLAIADNCTVDASLVVTSSDVVSGTCPIVVTRTYTIKDACLNSVTATQVFNITDLIAPTVTGTIPVATISGCSAASATTAVTTVAALEALGLAIADNCTIDASLVVTSSDVVSGTCPIVVTRTYTIKDACLNSVTVNQVFNITDLIAPTASNPASVSVSGMASIPASDPTVVINEADNCSLPTVAFVSDVSDGLLCPTTITRTYSVTDLCLNQILVTQLIVVGDAVIPTASNPAPVSTDCMANVPAANPLVVIDEADNGATPIVTWENDTDNLQNCPKTITRRYRVTDDCGNFIFVTQLIIIQPTTNPVVPANGSSTVNCLTNAQVVPTAPVVTDVCGNTLTPVVVTPANIVCEGPMVYTFTYTDCAGNTSTWTYTYTVDLPTFAIATAPGASTVNCSAAAVIQPAGPGVVTDLCGNTLTPVITSSAAVACEGNRVWTFTYTDCASNVVAWTYTYTVDLPTFAIATAPGASTVNCPAAAAIQPVGPGVVTDLCGNTLTPVITSSAAVACEGNRVWTFTYTDCASNVVAWTYTYTVDMPTFTIPYANGTSTVSCVANAQVDPVIPGVVTDQCGNTLTPVVTAPSPSGCTGLGAVWTYTYTDCAGNTLDWTYTYTVDLPAFTLPFADDASSVNCLVDAQVQPTPPSTVSDVCGNIITPVVTTPSDITCEGDMDWVFTYTDCAGNTLDWTYTYTIDLPNLIMPSSASENVQCIEDVYTPAPEVVMDACGNNIIPVMTQNMDPICIGQKIFTFTYTDCMNNHNSYSYTFNVNDNTLPTASNPAQITVQCIGDVPAPNVLVVTDEADNCAVPVVAFVSDVSDNNTCNGEIITRTYSVTDACGNAINVSQTILIDANTPNFTLSSTDPTTCGGNEGTITISGLNPLESYIITYGGINVPNTFNVAGNIVITGLTAGNYTSFIVKDANCLSCLMTDNTVLALVDPAPPVVDAGVNQAVCEGSLVVLSGAGAVTYNWNNLVSDGGAFPPAVGTVVYTVTGTDANGCTDTDQVTVTVNPLPIAPSGSQVTYCIDAVAIALFAETSAVTGFEVLSLNWYGTNTTGGIASSFAPTPSTAVVGLTNYYVSQTNTLTGCEGPRYAIPVTVLAKTITTFTQIPDVCQGLVASPLLPSSSNSPAIPGTWNPSTINTQIPGNAQYTFIPASNQCATTSVMNVVVNPTPIVVASVAPVCYPELIDLTAPSVTTGSTAGTTFSYFSNLNPLTVLSTPTVVTSSGTYYIQSTTALGCSNIAPVYVLVHPLPVASFNGAPALVSNYDAQSTMVNTSVDAVSYEWVFNDGTTSTETSPTHVFAADEYGEFEIKLTATSQFGCVDVTFGSVTVKEELVYYVPNSFTPNGDGDNDIFLPIFTSGYDPNEFSLMIFNRWGEILFESYDPKTGWKGTLGENGEIVQDGTYTWKIEFMAKSSPKIKVVIGHVNLLR